MKLICHPLYHYQIQTKLKKIIQDNKVSPLFDLYEIEKNLTIHNGISMTLYKNIQRIETNSITIKKIC